MARRRTKKAARRKTKPAVKLPTERSEPSDRLWDYSLLIFGEKKIGKTTLCAEIPNAFFLMVEPGGSAIRAYQPLDDSGRPKPIQSFVEFKAYVDRLVKGDHDYEVVVIDTINALYTLAFEHACQRLAMTHPSDEAYGKGWAAVIEDLSGPIRKLLNSPLGVVILSHSKDREIERWDGDTITLHQTSLSPAAADYVTGVVDVWAFYGYKGRERRLYIGGNEGLDAGNRIGEHFNAPDGTPLDFIPMGNSPAEAYANLLKAFDNELEPPKPKAKRKARRRRKGVKKRR